VRLSPFVVHVIAVDAAAVACILAPMAVHPTAIVAEGAELADDVEVGAYAIVDEHVKVGPGSRIGHHAYVTGWTEMGEGNAIHPFSVVGGEPQDLSYSECESYCRIGDRNVIRESATVHRPTEAGAETVVGNDCYLMANSHVAHDCRLGNNVIMANCALLGGFVTIGDRAFLSGGVVVHQFVRIGSHAFVSGNASISMDVPPYLTVRGRNAVCRINRVGLERSPLVSDDGIAAIASAYKLLYRSGLSFSAALEQLESTQGDPAPETVALIEFFRSSKRGVCGPYRRRRGRADEDDG